MNPLGNPADLVHAHLVLNHVPTIGVVLGLGLLLLAFARGSRDLNKVALEALFVIALATIPVYVTGSAAADFLQDETGVSEAAIAAHQNAAIVALLLMEVTGATAWLALWQFRRRTRSRRILAVVFVLSVVTLAVMGLAANLGGEIRHAEIVIGEGTAASVPAWIDARGLGEYVIGHLWIWPALETLHFIGMSLSFGVLLIVNLHMFGFMQSAPFAVVHRLLPWGMLGIGLNVVTGMLFFSGNPQQYMENPTFHWKVILLVPAGLAYLYLTVMDEAALAAAGRPRALGRIVAGASLCLWVGVLYFGRMLPYLRAAF